MILWLEHNSLCCSRNSTLAIDLRFTLKAYSLSQGYDETEVDDMLEIGEQDRHLAGTIRKNGGESFCCKHYLLLR